ncbi:hypothetical protein BJ165DRAFT_1529403 [Panaeolus papilionaceus]|nr:hypothetical protein BJ165DRAFT_1529403 [Panaeolus papilionaceus]
MMKDGIAEVTLVEKWPVRIYQMGTANQNRTGNTAHAIHQLLHGNSCAPQFIIHKFHPLQSKSNISLDPGYHQPNPNLLIKLTPSPSPHSASFHTPSHQCRNVRIRLHRVLYRSHYHPYSPNLVSHRRMASLPAVRSSPTGEAMLDNAVLRHNARAANSTRTSRLQP